MQDLTLIFFGSNSEFGMATQRAHAFIVGQRVTITDAPRELPAGLPLNDQKAIKASVGEPGIFVGADPYGNLEIEFNRPQGHCRTIWVDPGVVVPYEGGK